MLVGAEVPEPSSVALTGIGALGLLLAMARRRMRSNAGPHSAASGSRRAQARRSRLRP
ncbi:PEP-CTERM sorting domain-containing protein [Paucibacter sp. JuS9]|uniref:PEP-CTERM sorting domain-containing protein n=1 Tax=Roseateles TaxID=93681 RepID=UPI0037563F37